MESEFPSQCDGALPEEFRSLACDLMNLSKSLLLQQQDQGVRAGVEAEGPL